MSSVELGPVDAVLVDGFGTLVWLRDPVPALRSALADRGTSRSQDQVRRAFAAEVAYYRPRSHTGRDRATLAALRRDCVQVFLRDVRATVDIDDFIQPFMDSLTFELAAGAEAALAALRHHGLPVVCVANWDVGLHDLLEELGVTSWLTAVVTSAEARAEKPDPRIFRLALAHTGVEPHRALHVGDEEVDRRGAAAAGVQYAPPPLATLPSRLGLGEPA